MPGIPIATPTTDKELWMNLLYDLGIWPMPQAGGEPNLFKNWMTLLDTGLMGIALGHFGDGSDGVLNFVSAGSTTLAGATLSGGVYTMTRDIFLANGSIIAAGATIKTSGWRIFCAGNLVINGTIDSSGNAAAANVAGALLAYTSATISNTTVGTAGGAGATGAGNAGTANSTNALGGAGGAGGNNASIPNAGGAGGAVTGITAANQGLRTISAAISVRVVGTTALALVAGGAGGGSGGGDGTNLSGGGGGGGGIVALYANTVSGTGTVSAKGGAGGAAAAAGTPSGGGGGGGGCIIFVSGQVGLTPPTITAGVTTINGVTFTVAGGAAGAAGAGGGTPGAAGAAGTMVLLAN